MASVTAPSPTSADTPGPNITNITSPLCINQPWCVTQLVIHVIIFLLGVVGNGLVIWVIGFKMKQKTVTTRWYLSLAVSDFLFCATLPFYSHLVATGSWIFGLFMCKFLYFVLFLNIFSSVFLKVVISVDRCVGVVFPIWARNNRTVKRTTLTVVAAWLFAMVLSIPSLVVRATKTDNKQLTQCYNNAVMLTSSSPFYVAFRFVIAFVFPVVIITVCYSLIIVKLRHNRMARSARPFKVMTAVIVTFVLCWLPFHIFVLLDFNLPNTFITGKKIAWYLARASSCINPFLYAFMGKDVKKKLLTSLVSKIENAFNEEKENHTSHNNEVLSHNNDLVPHTDRV